MDTYDDYETVEEVEVEEDEHSFGIISVLALISTWFIRIGMVIAVILFLYFVITAKIFTALMYILGLVLAYFFGYFFMFCLDKFISVDD